VIVSLIAAVAANGVIGRDNQLPWRLRADLQRFRRLTMGHWLVMGRKTFESIGRPLPGRQTVVLSRQDSYAPPAGVRAARSLAAALALAHGEGAAEVFIAGGADVYRQALAAGTGSRLWLTRLHQDFAGDARLPDVDPRQWAEVAAERREPADDPDAPCAYTFLCYERRPDGDG
jgi:dihydrofolate reductase